MSIPGLLKKSEVLQIQLVKAKLYIYHLVTKFSQIRDLMMLKDFKTDPGPCLERGMCLAINGSVNLR